MRPVIVGVSRWILMNLVSSLKDLRFLVFLHTGCQGEYWTEQIDEQSQLLTAFNTPFKKDCFVRLTFGLSTCIDHVRVQESTEERHDIHIYWRLQRKLVKRESSSTHKSILPRNRKLSSLDMLSLRKVSNPAQSRCKESQCLLHHPTSKTWQSLLETVDAYHLARKSGNFGLKSNGKVIFRKFCSEIVEYRLQRYSSFSIRNGTAEISLPFAKLSSFQTLTSRKQLREIEVQMVSAISFGLEKPLPLFNARPKRFILTNDKHDVSTPPTRLERFS